MNTKIDKNSNVGFFLNSTSEVGWYSLHKWTCRRMEERADGLIDKVKTRWNQYPPPSLIQLRWNGNMNIEIATFLLIVLRALKAFSHWFGDILKVYTNKHQTIRPTCRSPMDSTYNGSAKRNFDIFFVFYLNELLKKTTIVLPVMWEALMPMWRHWNFIMIATRGDNRYCISLPTIARGLLQYKDAILPIYKIPLWG